MDSAAEAFHKVYGDEPREITIAFPSDDLENIMPQYLAAYRGGGGRSELWCKGDGETAGRADGSGGYVQIPCMYRDCPIYVDGKCKELTRLLFLLPDVEGIGVWELDTTSYHSAQNLVSSIQLRAVSAVIHGIIYLQTENENDDTIGFIAFVVGLCNQVKIIDHVDFIGII